MKNFKQAALAAGFILTASINVASQAEKNNLILNVAYYNQNNHVQYLKATAKAKIDGKFQMVPGIKVTFYITDKTPAHLLGKAITDDKGNAILFMPPSAHDEWIKSAQQSFVVLSAADKLYDAAEGSADVTKAKIILDTADNKKVTATLLAFKDTAWVAIKGVDIKLGIQRLGADLNINETPSYTTDSLGAVSGDFKRDSLPGDVKGNLILTAKVEDDDTYGNIITERIVPWGKPAKYVSNFDKRTLFARRGRSPIWLELMAYSIILVVWGILFYLGLQIRQLIRLGS